MPANRPRQDQRVPLIYIIALLAIAGCAGGFCVKLLNVKLRLVQEGQRLTRIKKEIEELKTKNEGLETSKERLISPSALTKAINAGFVNVVPIDPKHVIQVGGPKNRVAAVDIQPATGGAR